MPTLGDISQDYPKYVKNQTIRKLHDKNGKLVNKQKLVLFDRNKHKINFFMINQKLYYYSRKIHENFYHLH